MKIKKIYSGRLRNEAHYQFLTMFNVIMLADAAVRDVLGDKLVDSFAALLTLEGQLVDAMHSSIYSKELAEADFRRDNYLTGITRAIEAALHHFNPKMVRAAEALMLRIKAFRGSIEKKTYGEEAAAVRILTEDLMNTYFAEVQLLGLEDWVEKLSNAQADFDELYLSRNKELSNRPQEKLKDVRRQIDEVYHTMVDKVDAYSVVKGDPYDDFVGKLNQTVEYYNEHAHHHAKKDLGVSDHTVIEPIDTQKHTEKPITPVPVVYYREEGKPTLELSLGKDFEVTYKNNTKVGMAELTVHGKGAYKGSKTITFMIAE
jgi:hypothetical protein